MNAALREQARRIELVGRLRRVRRSSTASLEDNRERGLRGYNGAKKGNGRKRHLLLDTGGLLLRAKVHEEADLPDCGGAGLLLEPALLEDFSHDSVGCGRTPG